MRKVLMTLVAVAAILLVAPALTADSHEEGAGYTHVTHYKVDPAHADEWEELGRKWVELFANANMDPKWNWYMSVDNFQYTIVDRHENMASFDHGEEMQAEMAEALGAETMAALMEGMAGIDASVIGTEVVKNRPDLSFNSGDMEAMPGFLQVGVHTVRPGKEKDFEGLIKKVAEAWEQTGTPGAWDTAEVVIGQGSYVVVAFAESPAAFYANKHTSQVLAEAFGEEESNALYAAWRDCISDYQTVQHFTRPELSYVAEMHMGSEDESEDAADGEGDDS